MIDAIYYPPRFFRQLTLLKKSDKKGFIAATLAEEIISAFQKERLETELTKRKRTKNGEHRLKNCYKYDLGSGYRLLTVRSKKYLLLLATGTHDDVDSFIEEQRKNKFYASNYRKHCQRMDLAPPPKVRETDISSSVLPTIDLYEQQLQEHITEQMLQKVFPCFHKS